MAPFAGKPSSPKGPLDVSNVHDTGCRLKWEEPEDNGGMPIKEYEIEKMDLATGKWVRAGKVQIMLLSDVLYGFYELYMCEKLKKMMTIKNLPI